MEVVHARGLIEFPPTEEAQALADELKVFQMRATERGITAEAESGHHDDLVIALGLAVLFDPEKRRIRRARSLWTGQLPREARRS